MLQVAGDRRVEENVGIAHRVDIDTLHSWLLRGLHEYTVTLGRGRHGGQRSVGECVSGENESRH